MKIYIKLFLMIGIVFSAACRSPQYFERVEKIQRKANTLNGSKAYLSDMSADELKETREELVLVLLEEGETYLKSAQADLNGDALRKARLAFELVKAADSQEYSIQDLELVQSWRAMDWAWKECRHGDRLCGHGCRGTWNVVKLALPIIWPYTLAETTICFVTDALIGYESVEGKKIVLPKLDRIYITRAEFGIKEVDALVAEKKERTERK